MRINLNEFISSLLVLASILFFLNVPLQAQKERNEQDFQNQIPDGNVAAHWIKQIDKSWKTLDKSRNIASEQEAKVDFETTYLSCLKFYDLGSDSDKAELKNVILHWTASQFNRSLYSRKNTEQILKLFYHVSNKIGIGEGSVQGSDSQNEYDLREYFAGDIIVYMAESNDFSYESFLTNQLIPAEITDSRLAFNLSCLSAVRGKKKEMLKYMKIARQLGKPKSHFTTERDFKNFWNDPDFLELLK